MKNQLILFLIVFVSISSFAQNEVKRIEQFNIEKNNVAVQGYDVVSYFKQSKAVKGKKELALSYEGVVYYFSTQANKDAFKKNPTSYEPQYGGWCAYAMGNSGDKVEIDPETFKIIDGKLYLFYNAFFNNTMKSWNKDEANLKKKADANWKNILK